VTQWSAGVLFLTTVKQQSNDEVVFHVLQQLLDTMSPEIKE
jgi:hypothetical protein